ncbi:MAG: hypothetical protein ACP5PJ_06645 [Acidimicrobiales bacterium]
MGTQTAPSVGVAAASLATSVEMPNAGVFSVTKADGYWELLVRPAGQRSFSLITPPGVDSRPGIVFSSATATNTLTTGFRAASELGYSAIEQFLGGGSWSSALVPKGLIGSASALAVGTSGNLVAITGSPTAPWVYEASSGATNAIWHAVITPKDLRTASVSKGCGQIGLDGVIRDGNGFLFAVDCSGSMIRLAKASSAGVLSQVASVPMKGETAFVALLNAGGHPTLVWSSVAHHRREVEISTLSGSSVSTVAIEIGLSGGLSVSADLEGAVCIDVSASSTSSEVHCATPHGFLPQLASPPAGTSSIAVMADGIFAFRPVRNAINIYQLASVTGHGWAPYEQVNLGQLESGGTGG